MFFQYALAQPDSVEYRVEIQPVFLNIILLWIQLSGNHFEGSYRSFFQCIYFIISFMWMFKK